MSASVTEPNAPSGYSGIEDHSAPFHSFLEHGSSFIFPLLFGLNFYLAGSRLYELDLLWLMLIALPIAMVGGDLMSGIVHWAADTYFSENTPILGQNFVKPFRMHHVYPQDICAHNLVAIVGNSCIMAFPVLSLALVLLWLSDHWLLAFAVFSTALMSVPTVATNQFHKWAHQESPSAFARWLQRKRLVLQPSHHQLHHTSPFEMHYCITTGWLNPLLNRIQFFRRIEAALLSVGIQTAKAKEMERLAGEVD